MLAGSGRYCSDNKFWRKCPSTIQMTVMEPRSNDVRSLQHPGDWKITSIGHELDSAWQILRHWASRASGCKNNSRKGAGSAQHPYLSQTKGSNPLFNVTVTTNIPLGPSVLRLAVRTFFHRKAADFHMFNSYTYKMNEVLLFALEYHWHL